MYIVIADFIDLQDGNFPYKAGDTFPREGAIALPSRCVELSSEKNRRGIPLIKEIEDPKRTRPRKTNTE